jgi:hypothetical protein
MGRRFATEGFVVSSTERFASHSLPQLRLRTAGLIVSRETLTLTSNLPSFVILNMKYHNYYNLLIYKGFY